LQVVFEMHRREIFAGLHIFAGRRLIDAGEPREALSHFKKALGFSPRGVLRVWYKVAQAVGGALGLDGAFLAYRRNRRSLQHGARQLVVTENGPHWLGED